MYSSIFTMLAGNLAALTQTSVKRILAYSSIAHAGYILMGASCQTREGFAAMIFYIMIYYFMNLGAFWISSWVNDNYGGDDLKYFRGLSKRNPFYAICMAIFLFSLVGLPPFAGFVGKLYLFSAVISKGMYGFALIAAINSAISLYYYAKIAKAIFIEEAESGSLVSEIPMKKSLGTLLTQVMIFGLVLPNVILILGWEEWYQIANKALDFFVGK